MHKCQARPIGGVRQICHILTDPSVAGAGDHVDEGAGATPYAKEAYEALFEATLPLVLHLKATIARP
jgi:hypothetical protein